MMFCPFVKGECRSDCIFNGDDGACMILDNIVEIERNTGSDQTESWYIDNKLGEISDKLDNILKKI